MKLSPATFCVVCVPLNMAKQEDTIPRCRFIYLFFYFFGFWQKSHAFINATCKELNYSPKKKKELNYLFSINNMRFYSYTCFFICICSSFISFYNRINISTHPSIELFFSLCKMGQILSLQDVIIKIAPPSSTTNMHACHFIETHGHVVVRYQ